MSPRRRLVLLAAAAVLVLVGVLVVGYLPSRVDGGVEPTVRRVLAWLQDHGAPAWVDYDVADFLANIGFFVPIGLVGALLLPWRMWWLAVPAGALLSAAVEFGQYLFLPERYASASDVLANTAGALLGALIGAAARAARRQRGGTTELSRREASPRPAPPAARR
jgi:VanZ family protein